ncbi:MAG: hypothetical protein JST93_10485 [Acidobacteria bacterium]|nr:hypothetical protein [Acidobacteriota bacterium]
MRNSKGFVLPLALVMTAAGQTGVEVYRAELSAPFGAVAGKLVLHPQMLTFVDDERPASSFTFARETVKDLSEDKGTLVFQLAKAVRDRSGEITRVAFRMTPDTDAAAVTRWLREKPKGAMDVSGADMNFDAKQNKLIGGSKGKLMATQTQLIYEAVDDAAASRRWEYKDIKKFKRPNPYKVEIEPFSGSKLELELLGTAMEDSHVRTLTDRIAKARTAK